MILTLEWSDVDLDGRRITLRRERSKNGQPQTVPFVGPIGEIIGRRAKARTDGVDLVFHHDGESIVDFRKAWRKACEAAGTPKLLSHDLRRSAVRNLVAAGVDQAVACASPGTRPSACSSATGSSRATTCARRLSGQAALGRAGDGRGTIRGTVRES